MAQCVVDPSREVEVGIMCPREPGRHYGATDRTNEATHKWVGGVSPAPLVDRFGKLEQAAGDVVEVGRPQLENGQDQQLALFTIASFIQFAVAEGDNVAWNARRMASNGLSSGG